jgi:hypothetical protein
MWFGIQDRFKPISEQARSSFPAEGGSRRPSGLPTVRESDDPFTLKQYKAEVSWHYGALAICLALLLGFVLVEAMDRLAPSGITSIPYSEYLFVAIALLAIGAAIGAYVLVQRFVPRPWIEFDKPAVPLGESIGFRWGCYGNIGRISRLQIHLVGNERVPGYFRDERIRRRRAFARILVVDTDEKIRMSSGSADLVVPGDTMHTFQGNDNLNRIDWWVSVKLHLKILPDWEERFELIVLPKKLPLGEEQ